MEVYEDDIKLIKKLSSSTDDKDFEATKYFHMKIVESRDSLLEV